MRQRPSPGFAAFLAAVGIFTVWISWRAKALEMGRDWSVEPSALMGKPAPDFSLESLDGHKVSLADYRGKTVAVTFWASWCGPCRMEMPVLTKFYRQNHNAGSNFEILAISIDNSPEAARSAAHTMSLPFPVLLDRGGVLSDTYKVGAIPMLFVIDRAGKVTLSHTGLQMQLDFTLAQSFGIRNYTGLGAKP